MGANDGEGGAIERLIDLAEQECDEAAVSARAELAALQDKAIAFELDRAGIERRSKEASELVELRAENARLREALRDAVGLIGDMTNSYPGQPVPGVEKRAAFFSKVDALSSPAPADQQMADLMAEAERQHNQAAQSEIVRLREALEGARALIVDHHNATAMAKLASGCFCPVCVAEGGEEDARLVAISAALSSPAPAGAFVTLEQLTDIYEQIMDEWNCVPGWLAKLLGRRQAIPSNRPAS